MLGLKDDKPKTENKTEKKDEKSTQSDEAKKILAQMEAKKASDDCPFC